MAAGWLVGSSASPASGRRHGSPLGTQPGLPSSAHPREAPLTGLGGAVPLRRQERVPELICQKGGVIVKVPWALAHQSCPGEGWGWTRTGPGPHRTLGELVPTAKLPSPSPQPPSPPAPAPDTAPADLPAAAAASPRRPLGAEQCSFLQRSASFKMRNSSTLTEHIVKRTNKNRCTYLHVHIYRFLL